MAARPPAQGTRPVLFGAGDHLGGHRELFDPVVHEAGRVRRGGGADHAGRGGEGIERESDASVLVLVRVLLPCLLMFTCLLLREAVADWMGAVAFASLASQHHSGRSRHSVRPLSPVRPVHSSPPPQHISCLHSTYTTTAPRSGTLSTRQSGNQPLFLSLLLSFLSDDVTIEMALDFLFFFFFFLIGFFGF